MLLFAKESIPVSGVVQKASLTTSAIACRRYSATRGSTDHFSQYDLKILSTQTVGQLLSCQQPSQQCET